MEGCGESFVIQKKIKNEGILHKYLRRALCMCWFSFEIALVIDSIQQKNDTRWPLDQAEVERNGTKTLRRGGWLVEAATPVRV